MTIVVEAIGTMIFSGTGSAKYSDETMLLVLVNNLI